MKQMMHGFVFKQSVGLLFLSIIQLSMMSNATAQQCYANAQMAYKSMMNQEHLDAQISAKVGNAVININTATEAELTTLTGIGSSRAQDIILYREAFGAFNVIEDLARVKGVGTKTIDNNRARLKVSEP